MPKEPLNYEAKRMIQGIAERLKQARVDYNQNGKETIEEVAKATGIPKSTIGRMEKYADKTDIDDVSDIYLSPVPVLAKHYGVSSDYILGLTNVRTPETNVRAVCKYTGISEGAVAKLRSSFAENGQGWVHNASDFSAFVESIYFDNILDALSLFREGMTEVQFQLESALGKIDGVESNAFDWSQLYDSYKAYKVEFHDARDFFAAALREILNFTPLEDALEKHYINHLERSLKNDNKGRE
ncbi:MAG: helix-turn-helix transcriptional regulator [Oscillospiraceae bacterium]|nr:helix-turn-helix transcriptional regulator [Oscillospiraceae bacterium]